MITKESPYMNHSTGPLAGLLPQSLSSEEKDLQAPDSALDFIGQTQVVQSVPGVGIAVPSQPYIESVNFQIMLNAPQPSPYDYSQYSRYLEASEVCDTIIISPADLTASYFLSFGLGNVLPRQLIGPWWFGCGIITYSSAYILSPYLVKLPRRKWGVTVMLWSGGGGSGSADAGGTVTFINSQEQI